MSVEFLASAIVGLHAGRIGHAGASGVDFAAKLGKETESKLMGGQVLNFKY
ncbi:MAG: hypothetical protein IPJ42_03440 [Betaproteobacteria bacterium]|nr:hypothetical protein [Betaproteobacteria bacterium]